MPSGVFMYEIDETFGPKMIAEYYIEGKLNLEAVKTLAEKHGNDVKDATSKFGDETYYSSLISAKGIQDKIYLGFLLKLGEDIVSLKSLFKSIEERIAQDFNKKDKNAMQDLLSDTMTSILSLLDKLKNPKIIHDKINEKTKKMLDDGKISEAKELIDLGEKIPNLLATEVQQAEALVKQKQFKKAVKNYLKAAEYASKIQELEMVSFLETKAENVGNLPELIKERETLSKEIQKIGNTLDSEQLKNFPKLIPLLDKALYLSSTLQEDVLVNTLTELKKATLEASNIAKTLYNLDKQIKEFLTKI